MELEDISIKAKTKEHDLGKATQGIRIYRMPWVAQSVEKVRLELGFF